MLPSAFPALDVTTAPARGIKVMSTIRKLFRWIHNKNPSRKQKVNAAANTRNENIGIQV
jgi:hypothetical protein